MKNRKHSDLIKMLTQKGFERDTTRNHHLYFRLVKNGKKTNIYTFLSHDGKDYDRHLMSQVKKQMMLKTSKEVDDFFDCTMSGAEYLKKVSPDREGK